MPATETQRDMYVVKANQLIRNTRYNFTVTQQRCILYAISAIKPGDDPRTWYEFDIIDFCKTVGIDLDTGGFYYREIKKALLELTKYAVWMEREDGTQVTVRWLDKAQIIPLMGTVSLRFDEDLHPYLFNLSRNYTQYQLRSVLAFSSKYGIRLYEALRSYYTQRDIEKMAIREINFTQKQLRDLFLTEGKYERWPDFETRALKPAIEDINKYSDEMHVEYEKIRQGHTIGLITFIISPPRHRLRNAKRRDDKLNHITNYSPAD